VHANHIKVILLFLDESIDGFGCAQDVVYEDVVEEFDVGSSFF